MVTKAKGASIHSYPLLADLRAAKGLDSLADGDRVSIGGRTVHGVGGGEFWYDKNDNSSEDDGKNIIVTAGGARWKRVHVVVSQDTELKDRLFIFCGDSTTEQAGGNGYGFDYLTTNERTATGRLKDIKGTVNLGGSGAQFNRFISETNVDVPVIDPVNNLGVGAWDYYGHKPVGAVNLVSSLKWREGKGERVTWVVCYGINDCILNAAIGGLDQNGIEQLIVGYLQETVTRIVQAYPDDSIILRAPNPMTARPTNPAFPSTTAYPTFGDDLVTDQALVEKWNQAMHRAYTLVDYSGALVLDTWDKVFGPSNVTVDATAQAGLNDLVHPSNSAYSSTFVALVDMLKPVSTQNSPRLQERAEDQATTLGLEPWEVDPNYCEDNIGFTKVVDYVEVVGIGSNYIDMGISRDEAVLLFGNAGSININLNGSVTQEFAGFSISASASNARLTGVAPIAEMQGEKGFFKIYIARASEGSGDSYIDNLSVNTYRFVFTGSIGGAGNGYIDFGLDPKPNRVSSAHASTLIPAGKLAIGNGNDVVVDLSTATASMSGIASQRSLRILLAGDHTAYANSTAALVYDNAAKNPYALDTV